MILHSWFTKCNCPGFIEYNYVDFMRNFKALGILDENTVIGSLPNSDHDRCRSCQPQCTGTGYYKNGNDSEKTSCKCTIDTGKIPYKSAEDCNRNHNWNKYPGNFIHEVLNRSLASLCFPDHFNNLSQQSIASYFFGPELKTSFLINCPGK